MLCEDDPGGANMQLQSRMRPLCDLMSARGSVVNTPSELHVDTDTLFNKEGYCVMK